MRIVVDTNAYSRLLGGREEVLNIIGIADLVYCQSSYSDFRER